MESNAINKEIKTPGYLKFSKVLVWLMYLWVMIGVASLSMRVFLLAFSANMSAGFANFVLTVSEDYMHPFRGIFSGRNLGDTGYLDVSAMFAIIVYLFVAWGFKALIEYIEQKTSQAKAYQHDELLQQEREGTLRRNQKAASDVRPRNSRR
jgi:uncharacterized protein YggT (Ycf19 family)